MRNRTKWAAYQVFTHRLLGVFASKADAVKWVQERAVGYLTKRGVDGIGIFEREGGFYSDSLVVGADGFNMVRTIFGGVKKNKQVEGACIREFEWSE